MYTHTHRQSDWGPCQLQEHVCEVRTRVQDVAAVLEEIAARRLAEPIELCLAAVAELVDHCDGLHEDDVLVRLLEEGQA